MPESDPGKIPEVPFNFLALNYDQSRLDQARVVLIPVPYDSTTSMRTGAREGPNAMIQASNGLEDYDWELDLDVSELGIHTTAALEPHMGGPEQMLGRVKQAVAAHVGSGKIVGLLGGEHSLSVGAVQAHLQAFPGLSVLYLDAHADLRDEFMGTPWGHASGARRIHELCPLVWAGVRSACQEERDFIVSRQLPVFRWPPEGDQQQYNSDVVSRLSSPVYISLDLDVLDPSLMPATGTPEPGGMDWHQLNGLLRAVAQTHRIVGFDLCELSPAEGPPACSYTAAKLAYKLAAYAVGSGE